jgi:hypothetical protein
MIEGSESVPCTNGSFSEKPKNMRILWIRIRNTAVIINRFQCQCCGFGSRKAQDELPKKDKNEEISLSCELDFFLSEKLEFSFGA